MEKNDLRMLLLLTYLLVPVESANMFSRGMKFTNASIKFNPEYYSNATISVVKGTMNTDMFLIKPLTYGIYANVDTQFKLSDSHRYQSLFVYTFEACRLLNEQIRENLMKTWFRNMLKYSNLLENCPMPEGHYYIRKMVLESNSLPAYLRVGDYRMIAGAFYGKRKAGRKQKLVIQFTLDLKIF